MIAYEGFNEGVAFDGGKGEGYSLEIGSNTFIPGFEVQLIGAKAGDDVDVNVTFPTEYHSEELAGKPALFKVKVHEVKEKILPELDDEFAKDVSEFDTLEEYKKSIYDKLLEKKTNDSRDAFLDLLLAQIEENMQADINEGMIDERVDRVVEDYAQRLASQGMPFEQYLQMFGMTLEQFKAQSRPGAEKQIKSELALTKIAELENITVTEEDKDKEYQKMADMYHVELESVKEFFDVEILTDSILMTKAADFVIENAVALPEPKEEEKAEEAEAPAEEKKPAKKTTRKSTKKAAETKEEEAAPAEATEE